MMERNGQRMPYPLLVIEGPDGSIAPALRSWGYAPRAYRNTETAIEWLQGVDGDGIERYRRVAAIVCEDEREALAARRLLAWKNKKEGGRWGVPVVDGELPLVLLGDRVSRHAFQELDLLEDGELPGQLHVIVPGDSFYLRGYAFIEQKGERGQWLPELRRYLDELLFEIVPSEKEVLVVKYGGSAGDYLESTPNGERFVSRTLQHFALLQESGRYQIVLVSGAGPYGENPRRYLRSREQDTYARLVFPSLMGSGIVHNLMEMERLLSIGSGRAKRIPKRHIPRSLYWKGAAGIKEVVAENSVVCIEAAPRHFRMDYPNVVKRDCPTYPNIPLSESDAQTLLVMDMFRAEKLFLLKRTTHLCAYTPFRGASTIAMDSVDVAAWREAQRDNRALYGLSPADVLAIDRSEEGTTDHFIEDSALRLLAKSRREVEIYPVHPNPKEFMPGGAHILPNVPRWYGTAGETIDAILRGEVPPSIVHHGTAV